MKILALILTLLFAGVMTGSAQISESVTLRVGQQKTAPKSKVTIKFISVTEDSRCPKGVDCVWAGNAKVKVKISSGGQKKIFEFNTTIGPKGDILDGWAIRIETLSPEPTADRKPNPKLYTATFDIARLTR